MTRKIRSNTELSLVQSNYIDNNDVLVKYEMLNLAVQVWLLNCAIDIKRDSNHKSL